MARGIRDELKKMFVAVSYNSNAIVWMSGRAPGAEHMLVFCLSQANRCWHDDWKKLFILPFEHANLNRIPIL